MPAPIPQELVDAQGRRIRYLRLSLTDRCNFACSYCSPQPVEGCETLRRDEILRLVRVFAAMGVERVRLTGGEPTLRQDLLEVIRDIADIQGIQEIALTTNGQLLAQLAAPLREAGVARVNVSLDTLDPERLRRLSGRAASLTRIVEGVEQAGRAGFASLKLNAVVLKGVNEDELGRLARFAWAHGAIARFIELMPFGARGEPVPISTVKRLLEEQGILLEPDATRGWGPARHMRGTCTGEHGHASGLVGFIGAMTENFCHDCNRVRLGADGALRACLGGRDRVELVPMMRAGASDSQLETCIRAALLARAERHDMVNAGSLAQMVRIGG